MQGVLFRLTVAGGMFLIFTVFAYNLCVPSNNVLAGKWEVISRTGTFTTSVPFEVKVKTPQWVIAQKEFSLSHANRLIIPGVNGGGMEVYINGHLVYQSGDIKNGHANMWNSVHVISFDPSILKKHNILRIKFYALYNAGLSFIPYIGNYDNLRMKIMFVNFFKYDIVFFMMGMMMSLAAVLFTISALEREGRRKYFAIAMASLLTIVYLVDLVGWNAGSVFVYLLVRKISMVSLYFAIFLFFYAMEKELFNSFKISKIFLTLTILVSIYVVLQPSPLAFHSSLFVGKIFLGVSVIILLFEVYRKKAVKYLFPITLANLLTVFYFVLELKGLRNSFGPIVVIYSTMTVIGSIGIMLTENYHRNYSTKIVLYKEALLDPLTRVFNRKVLEEVPLSTGDVVVMVDMDDFKKVNDIHGHDVGDELLKLFCAVSERNLRKGDMIVRYGGDEFLLILENCTKKDAVTIVQRIRETFRKESKPYHLTFSFGVERVTKNLATALKKADAKMYSMKEQLKKG